MNSHIDLIYFFCSPYYPKAAARCLFLSSLAYQSHKKKQLTPIADSCITQWFELFYKIPLILYCEHLQHFAKKYEVPTSCPHQSLDI